MESVPIPRTKRKNERFVLAKVNEMDLERWDDDVYDNVVQVLELEYSNHIVPVYNIIHH